MGLPTLKGSHQPSSDQLTSATERNDECDWGEGGRRDEKVILNMGHLNHFMSANAISHIIAQASAA